MFNVVQKEFKDLEKTYTFEDIWGNPISYIYFACLYGFLFVCLTVCFYPINAKTADPTAHNPRKDLWMLKITI